MASTFEDSGAGDLQSWDVVPCLSLNFESVKVSGLTIRGRFCFVVVFGSL